MSQLADLAVDGNGDTGFEFVAVQKCVLQAGIFLIQGKDKPPDGAAFHLDSFLAAGE